jgi:hypothetical protein
MGLPSDAVRRRVGYWLQQGLLVPVAGERDSYRLWSGQAGGVLTAQSSMASAASPAAGAGLAPALADSIGMADDELQAGGGAKATMSENEAVWRKVEELVLGMVNFEPMPLERIHTMLGMLRSEDFPYHGSAAELAAFLQRLVKADKIDFLDNAYAAKSKAM